MTDAAVENLLARLAGRGTPCDGSPEADPYRAIAATQPEPALAKPNQGDALEKQRREKLDELLGRIAHLTAGATSPAAAAAGGAAPTGVHSHGSRAKNEFFPEEPTSLQAAKLTESEVEGLVLKYLLSCGNASGRDTAEQVKLPFGVLEEMLRQMKNDQWVVYRSAAAMNDYQYQLTDKGRERARRLSEHCTYFGSTPVSLTEYIASVAAQSMTTQHPTADDLRRAFSDLLINSAMLARLGPAINSGRGLFLYGAAGNGKTSIAERVTRAFGEFIWIPRAIGVDGEIIRLFDPSNHDEAPIESTGGLLDNRKIDKRWVRIRRPTIVVGGELTMDNLEVTRNTSTGICEAPMQLKSNCGTLVIDDFGRQRMSTDELLNRWIVPLEKRFDFLNLPNGKKIQVPFDQLIIFSTNLQPRDLVDEAFLRRIPYKIDVVDPSEEEFRELLKLMAPKVGFEYRQEPIDYLIEKHYKQGGRPFRNCQPRDLLMQVRNFCFFQGRPLELTSEYFDRAVENYFAVI
ncbi:MAG TPA: AAA family ATPase [Pirellulales bacterium]|jgi:DNA-binding PadR family transcriptional regulator|nr:AAA family ATPase [Pirellulales bacterium]